MEAFARREQERAAAELYNYQQRSTLTNADLEQRPVYEWVRVLWLPPSASHVLRLHPAPMDQATLRTHLWVLVRTCLMQVLRRAAQTTRGIARIDLVRPRYHCWQTVTSMISTADPSPCQDLC